MSLKILPKKEIRAYELTMLLPTNLTSDELETARVDVRAVLKKNSITITEETEWGKKYLAYTIKHTGVRHNEANYLHWLVTAAPKQIAKLEFELQNHPKIIRHLFVLAEAKVEEKQAA